MTTTTLTDTTSDTLEGLDFRPGCTCEFSGCGHAEGVECGAEACLIATVHEIHHCDSEDCDPFGDVVGPVCQPCLERMTAAAASYAADVQAVTRRFGGHAVCRTCGAPMMHVSDIIRDVRPIK